jgi:hypothetical protein
VARATSARSSRSDRRFPTREALIDGLIERELEEARAMISAASLHAPSESALRELCAELIALGARYAFPMAHARLSGTDAVAAGLEEFLTRCQHAGVLRDDIPARWLAHTLGTLGLAVVEARRDMDLDEAGAADLLVLTFLDGARAPHRSRRR